MPKAPLTNTKANDLRIGELVALQTELEGKIARIEAGETNHLTDDRKELSLYRTNVHLRQVKAEIAKLAKTT